MNLTINLKHAIRKGHIALFVIIGIQVQLSAQQNIQLKFKPNTKQEYIYRAESEINSGFKSIAYTSFKGIHPTKPMFPAIPMTVIFASKNHETQKILKPKHV